MSDFVERLPWRLAALAGLLVGSASLIAGTDSWVCLLRVGATFLLFGVLGMGLRALLRQGLTQSKSKKKKPSDPTSTIDESGSQGDKTTPEMTSDDL